MQLQNDLYQIGGDLNGITWAGVDAGFEDGNSYVLNTEQGLILFDCGCGDTLDQIFQNMTYWGLNLEDIKYCFLTHSHLDHAGGAHMLKKRNVVLVAHRSTAEAIATGDERCCGFLYHKVFTPCEVDIPVEDDDVIEVCGITIEAMHLPGHTTGCTAWWFTHENRRIVVSGDVIGTLLRGDFGWDGSIDFNKSTYVESLKRFARTDPDIMLSGHGMSHFYKPRRRIEQVLNEALIQFR